MPMGNALPGTHIHSHQHTVYRYAELRVDIVTVSLIILHVIRDANVLPACVPQLVCPLALNYVA